MAAALVLAAGSLEAASPKGGFSADAARKLFATGLDNINAVYIRKIKLGNFALDALKGLTAIDGGFSAERRGKRVAVSVANAPIADYGAPDDDDAGGWAELMAKALGAARSHSHAIRAEEPEKLYKTVLEAGVATLDKYSRYAPPDSARENRAAREGFGGVGIRLDSENDAMIVQSVLPGTPAEKAGMKARDRLLRIAGKPVIGLEMKDVVSLTRGKVGTTVTIEVERDGIDKPLKFEIKRALIVPPTITVSRSDDVVEIKVSSFNHDTGVNLSSALEAVRNGKNGNGKFAGIILDMRSNPGGLLDQAVVVADLFLTSGQIVSTRGRHQDSTQLFNASGRDAAKNVPVVVLVNGTSASAAEIVAGALQDRGRAVLVGTSTFGKGSVQTVIRMPNDGELTLTWAHFHAPSGYSIDRLGVFPTICTSTALATTSGLAEALEQGQLRNTVDLTQRRAADAFADKGKDELHKVCPYQAGNDNEVDVRVAKALLHNPELYQRALKQSLPSLASRQ
ncbi:MAG: S41 family peptidase [Rhodospirillales bacterium]